MTNLLIYGIGFLAQLLFSLRFLIQWLKSEKKKQVVLPKTFWFLSLLGAFLLFIYGYLRTDFAIILGQVLTYFIYIRNLQLQNKWKTMPILIRYLAWFAPLLISVFYLYTNTITIDTLFRNKNIPTALLLLGIVAQIIFTSRFVYQWIYSENIKTPSLPLGFWILSAFGALLIMIYAVFRKDPVLLIAHFFGTILYFRNIILLKNQKNELNTN